MKSQTVEILFLNISTDQEIFSLVQNHNSYFLSFIKAIQHLNI